MKVENSAKLWTGLFTVILLGIVGYFGYKYYFSKDEVVDLNQDDETIEPTTAPFRWDLYLDEEEATKEAVPTKKVEEKQTTPKTSTTTTQPAQAVTKTTETTVTTTTTTNVDGKETSETQTYTTNDGNINVEVKSEARSESSN